MISDVDCAQERSGGVSRRRCRSEECFTYGIGGIAVTGTSGKVRRIPSVWLPCVSNDDRRGSATRGQNKLGI